MGKQARKGDWWGQMASNEHQAAAALARLFSFWLTAQPRVPRCHALSITSTREVFRLRRDIP